MVADVSIPVPRIIQQNPTDINVGNITVGTVAAAGPNVAPSVGTHVALIAPFTNPGAVFVGPAGVTTATGRRMDPGAILKVSVRNLNSLHFIAGATGNVIEFIVETGPVS